MKRLCATLLLFGSLCCAQAAQKSPTIVYINGAKYYVHTVQPGETLYSLSREYGVGEQVIVEHNPEVAAGLKADARLKIPFQAEVPRSKSSERKLKKTFETHRVSKGETLYAIARRYEISIQTILEDNPNLDPTHLRLGEQILIRRKETGKGSEAQSQAEWEAYRTALNSVADKGYAYHIVRPGETFYSLSRRFGITEEELSRLNNGLKASELKAGAMLKIPSTETAAVPAADSLQVASHDSISLRELPEISFRALRRTEPLEVALMLPISVDGRANDNYLEFYQGFLLGLEQVKQRYGYSANLTFYNSGRDTTAIRRIVESPEFARTQLIVGPVYEDELHPVIQVAEQRSIPVVSPLANIGGLRSDALFQMAADPALKYDKVAELFNGNRRVTLIYADKTDKEFEQEVLALLGDRPYTRHNYRYEHPSVRKAEGSPSDLTPLLQNKEENVFVILAENEVDVDRILAAIASADTSITSRGFTAPSFVVLGNARWHRFNNIDRTMFFKDRVVFVSTYHAKRDAAVITDFDSSYIRSFGALPTLYSYRGYDAAMIFCPAMYGDIEKDLENTSYTPLQTTYRFERDDEGNHVNRNWTRVNYNSDYTITIE